ncbi:MAG: hypothetical protein N2053_09300 [Chitinispirillaceae bacterium]|nr:hypothetical protein [Chitinispirillaceae bacterium]
MNSNTSFSLYNFRYGIMNAMKNKGLSVIAVAPEDNYSYFLKQDFEYFPIRNLNRKGTNPITDLKLLIGYINL